LCSSILYQVDEAMARGDLWPPPSSSDPASPQGVVATLGGATAQALAEAPFEGPAGGSLATASAAEEDEDESALFDALLARIGFKVMGDPPAPAAARSGRAGGWNLGDAASAESEEEEAGKAGEGEDDREEGTDDALLARALGATSNAAGGVYQPFLKLPPATSPLRPFGGAAKHGAAANPWPRSGKGGAAAKLAAELPLPQMVRYHLDETTARDEKRRGGK
jgi:hypothetical protein